MLASDENSLSLQHFNQIFELLLLAFPGSLKHGPRSLNNILAQMNFLRNRVGVGAVLLQQLNDLIAFAALR
jgi:hypothetical protein